MERKKFFLSWRCPKMSNLATLFTATQGAFNTETFVFQDDRFGYVTEPGLYSRRASRYTRGVQRT